MTSTEGSAPTGGTATGDSPGRGSQGDLFPGIASDRASARGEAVAPGGDDLLPGLSVALVQDWLVTWGGSELVLRALARLFPRAPIYTSVWHPDERVREAFGGRDVRTTLLDRLPASGRLYRWLLPAMPAAFRRLDLDDFDVVISSSHALCKSVRAAPEALHLCYCHTPPRYLWELAAFHNRGLAGLLRKPVVRALRRSDLRAAAGVDRFIANSECVRDRIRRTYGRDATVVYPPVEVERFAGAAESAGRDAREPGDYYLAGGRLVPYKELDVVVEAANRARLRLKLFGDGPEKPRLERMAGPTVEVLGQISNEELAGLMAGCRAFLFPGIEDFGILPVEVQAAGSPVVARGVGGALETVRDGETGILYHGTGAEGLLEGIERLEKLRIDPKACRRNAERFGPEVFSREVGRFVRKAVGAARAGPR